MSRENRVDVCNWLEGSVEAAKILADIVKSSESAKDSTKTNKITIAGLSKNKVLSFVTHARLTKY